MGRNHKRTLRVWEKANNISKPYGYHIHHIDGNNSNDIPSNLICVTREEHAKIHLELYKKHGNPKDAWSHNRLTKGDKLKGFKFTEEHKAKLRGKRKGGWKNGKEFSKACSDRMKGKPMSIKTKKNLSKPIICINIKTEKTYEFFGQREAAVSLDLNFKCINNVLRGISKTHKGYSFKYK